MGNLVVFGDSWCYGDELSDEARLTRSFPALIAKTLGLELQNRAVSGNSLQGTIWDLLLWNDLDADADLVLVGMTSGARTSWWRSSQPFWHSVWIEHGGQKQLPGFQAAEKLNRIWRSEIYHWHQDRMTYLTLLNNLSAIGQHRNIPLLVFEIYHGFERPTNMRYDFLIQDFAVQNWLQQQQESSYFMPGGHPSESGHERIAEHLLSIIECRKLM